MRNAHFLTIATTLALLLAPLTPSLANNAESFLWAQANASIAKANSPEAFLASAHLYRSLLERAPHRPIILQNYGTALLLAERPNEALDAFLRAECLQGSSPDLTHNIRVALEPASLPWSRVLFPWHFSLPLHLRILITLAAWTLFWLLLPFRKRRASRPLLVLALLSLAAFTSSISLSLHAHHSPLPPIPPPPSSPSSPP